MDHLNQSLIHSLPLSYIKRKTTEKGKYGNCRKKSSKVSPKPSCNDLQRVFQAQNKSCYLGDNLRTALSCHPKYSTAAWLRSCTAPGEAAECDMPRRTPKAQKKRKSQFLEFVQEFHLILQGLFQFTTVFKQQTNFMLKSWIMLELQSQHSLFLDPCSAAPDWWAKVETKHQKAHGRGQGASRENPECQTTPRRWQVAVPRSDTLRSTGGGQCVEESQGLQKSQQGWGWTYRT